MRTSLIAITFIALAAASTAAAAQSCSEAAPSQCGGAGAGTIVLASLLAEPAPTASERRTPQQRYAQSCPIPPRCERTCNIRVDDAGCIVWECCPQ